MHSKILASTLASALALPAVLVGGATLLSPSVAEAAITEATCRIHAVEASTEGDGTIPKELDFIADQLSGPQFAGYKGFRLIEAKDYKLKLDRIVDEKFKSGHNVKLKLTGGERDKLELHTELVRGSSKLVTMDFGIKSNQIVLIPVLRGDSAVIFAYQCKS